MLYPVVHWKIIILTKALCNQLFKRLSVHLFWVSVWKNIVFKRSSLLKCIFLKEAPWSLFINTHILSEHIEGIRFSPVIGSNILM